MSKSKDPVRVFEETKSIMPIMMDDLPTVMFLIYSELFFIREMMGAKNDPTS